YPDTRKLRIHAQGRPAWIERTCAPSPGYLQAVTEATDSLRPCGQPQESCHRWPAYSDRWGRVHTGRASHSCCRSSARRFGFPWLLSPFGVNWHRGRRFRAFCRFCGVRSTTSGPECHRCREFVALPRWIKEGRTERGGSGSRSPWEHDENRRDRVSTRRSAPLQGGVE